MVCLAHVGDFDAIAALNVEAHREFADRMSPDGWHGIQASVCAVEARAQSVRFLVMRDQGIMGGSIGYCPAGKGNPEIFPLDWAAVLLLAVTPTHCCRGIARERESFFGKIAVGWVKNPHATPLTPRCWRLHFGGRLAAPLFRAQLDCTG